MRVAMAVLAMAISVSGCVSQPVAYQPRVGVPNAKSVVEEAFMSQDEDARPDSIQTTDEYVEMRTGVAGGVGLLGKVHSKAKVTRIYYRSVAKAQLFTKHGSYTMVLEDEAGNDLAKLDMRDRKQGQSVADAFETLKARP